MLVAWSLGGTAALSLALHHEQYGFKFKAAVLLAAPAGALDPITGAVLTEKFPAARTAFEVVHGRNDTVVDPGDALQIVRLLKAAGNRSTLTLIGADHGSIVMAEHNVTEDNYAPSDTEETLMIGESVASIVATHATKH